MNTIKLLSICAMAVGLAQSFSAEAALECTPKELLAVFRDTSAMKASCLPGSESKELIQRNDIVFTKYWDQSPSRSIVSRIVGEAQRLSMSGAFVPFNNIAVEVDQNFRILGQQVFDPQLKRPKVIIQEPANVSLYAHEMGHILGNTQFDRRMTWYAAYNKAVPQPCHLSCYARSGYDQGRRNEEFAEVHSAYLTNPRLLQQGGASCRRAFQFFRAKVFPKKDPSCFAKPVAVKIPLPVPSPLRKTSIETKPTADVKPDNSEVKKTDPAETKSAAEPSTKKTATLAVADKKTESKK